jgi:hypothetical protein
MIFIKLTRAAESQSKILGHVRIEAVCFPLSDR